MRDEFDGQGMSEDWSEFVISSFAEALGWNYTPKVQNQQVQSQTQQKQKTKQVQNQSSNQMDWTCSCGTVNNDNFCGNCGKSKPVPKTINWTCSCGTVNKNNFCTHCGKTEQQAIQPQKQPLKQMPKQTPPLKQVQQSKQQKQSKQVQHQSSSSSNPFINAKVGDYIKFGNYPQTANGDILPIEWLVLAKENIDNFDNVDELLIGLGNFINYYNTERIKLKFKTSPVKYRQMQEKNN